MAHEIFGSRFLTNREPAWHGLGHVVEEELSAKAAFERIGRYEVGLHPLAVEGLPDVKLDQQAIVRSPTSDDPHRKVFGLVGPDYTLITPDDLMDLWDEHVAKPVETIGALKEGATLFVSTKLPDFNVQGDPIENYLLAVSPMTGSDAAEVRVTPIRVVCQNTLSVSARLSSEVYRIIHDSKAKVRMGTWLNEIVDRAETRSKAIEESFNLLAEKAVVMAEVEQILQIAYPETREPAWNAPDDVMELRLERWKQRNRTMKARREQAEELFEGKGTGLDRAPAKGTAWGLYNAVVELEDYRRGRSVESISHDALFGRRAKTKERAFASCLILAQGGTLDARTFDEAELVGAGSAN